MRAHIVIANMAFLSAFAAVNADEPKMDSPKKRELPRWFQCECCPGTVKAIDENSITIADLNNPTKITTYPLHQALAAGGVVDNTLDSNAYGVKEIVLGDIVRAFAFKENNVEFCLSISISAVGRPKALNSVRLSFRGGPGILPGQRCNYLCLPLFLGFAVPPKNRLSFVKRMPLIATPALSRGFGSSLRRGAIFPFPPIVWPRTKHLGIIPTLSPLWRSAANPGVLSRCPVRRPPPGPPPAPASTRSCSSGPAS